MSATYGKEIKFGGPGGQEVTDASFYYDLATQTLHVTNLTATDLVFSGETLTSPTFDGAVVLGSTSAATINVTGTLTFNTAPTLATSVHLIFRDSASYINSPGTGKLVFSGNSSDVDALLMSGKTTFNAAVQISAATIFGVDGTGHNITIYGDTAGQKVEWLQSTDTLKMTASTLCYGTLTVGVDATGYDVYFYGDTTGKYFRWDQANDKVILVGALTQTGNTDITGTLGVTGNSTITGTFGVTGATTITSASASSLAVGRLGATTPAFVVDSSTGTQAAGLKVVGATTTGTVAVVTIGGASVNLTINATGTGTIGIGTVSTGAVTITPATTITGLLTLTAGVIGAMTVTSNSALSLAVGRLGATTPAFSVSSATGSQVAGLLVTGAATGGTVAVVTTDSGAVTSLTINAKGTGTIGIGTVSTGLVTITPACTIAGAVIHSLTTSLVGVTTVTAIAGIVSALATTNQRIVPFFGAGGQDTPAPTAAIPLNTYLSLLDSTAGATTQTLAASTIVGQMKKITMVVAGGNDVVTVTSMTGGTTLTFSLVGDTVELMWNGTAWIVLAKYNQATGSAATPAIA